MRGDPGAMLVATWRPTSWRFVAWWLVLLLLHALCIGYYVGFALAYRHLPKSNLAFQFRTYSIGIHESEYANIAVAHTVVAALHALHVLFMVGGSLQVRHLAFQPRWWRIWRGTVRKPPAQSMSRQSRRTSAQESEADRPRVPLTRATFSHSVVDTLRRAAAAIVGHHGLLGIEFVYFDHLLLVRELVETGLQSYQAFRMTRLLPHQWLVRLYVALLVTNCWAAPALHRVYAHRPRVRRMMSLICDTVLDVVSSIGVSLFLVTEYAPQYTDARFGFPFNNWYDDEWFVAVLQEFQMMVVVSWGDMASRLVFAFGVLQSLDNLKDMLTQDLRRRKSAAIRAAAMQRASAAAAAIAPAPGVPPPPKPAFTRLSTNPSTRDALADQPAGREHSVVSFLLHVAAPALFVAWGIAIFGVHVFAESRHVDLSCRHPIRPWLSTKPACSLVEIDCHLLGTDRGIARKPANAWTAFDPALTAGLVIRHCPELTIPPSMALYTGITSMKVYNATIVAWPEASGLSRAAHARLRALYLVRTNFSDGALPPGLTRRDFPQSFRSFMASATNLASLPADLDTVWPPRMAISIEWAGFTSIPDVIIRLCPGMISFSRNPIAAVPASLFEIPTLGNLLLSYTDLQELPRNVTHLGARLYLIFVEGTNVSTFWSWMDPFITRSLAFHKGFFNAHGTPFCRERAEILAGTRTHFSTANDTTGLATIMDVSTPARRAFAQAAVACESDFKTLFPLAAQDATSAIA